MTQKEDFNKLLQDGLLAGGIVLFVATVGMVETFSERQVVAGIVSLGTLLMLAPPMLWGYLVARRPMEKVPEQILTNAGIVGIISSLPIIGMLILRELLPIRNVFVNITENLVNILTFQQESLVAGGVLFIIAVTIASWLGAAMVLLPDRTRSYLFNGLGWLIGLGIMSELIVTHILRNWLPREWLRTLFDSDTLRPVTAAGLFAVILGISWLWFNIKPEADARYARLPGEQQLPIRYGSYLVGILVLLALPILLGSYFSEALSDVGLYVLMGLGLNIAVGMGGLLDLGYVTNFAVGAYIMGKLTSTGLLGVTDNPEFYLSFWTVLPVALVAAMFTGFVLALPVLKMRGDYLAIATLGFGEIIELLAKSDWLRPYIGGAQGMLFIPKPEAAGFEFTGPRQIYYIILVACFFMMFIALRLNNSRTGRQWMALREDEDVARAMGIDTHVVKTLAFTLSAASGGVAGAIFAAKVGAIFPNSFDVIVSINVLCIIIIGGMGSIPGIVLGALALRGPFQLLSEFAEYRLLIYGALLVFMMRARPEGLWPSAVHRRELQSDELPEAAAAAGD